MTKKPIAFAIILLVFIFPFRWAYLEYPEPLHVNGSVVDAGGVRYVFYFLMCVAGFLAFFLMSTDTDKK